MKSLRRGVKFLGLRSTYPRSFSVAANGSPLSSLARRQLPSSGVCSPVVRPLLSVPVQQNAARNASTATASGVELKRTQLYDLHVERGAKMVPFAGFSMPLQYSDLSHVESHNWTREKASLFDVSHMVQHQLRGPAALQLLMKVTPSSLDKLADNSSTLSCLLEEGTGGIVDDTVITRLGKDSFYFVTNAGRREEDLAFLQKEIDELKAAKGANSVTWDVLDNRALLALQGPAAASVLQSFIHTEGEISVDTDLSTLYFGQCRSLRLTLPDGKPTPRLLVSRTGYTGEDGFEISIPTDDVPTLPRQVAELLLSKPDQVRLAGLAARDSLRLEAGMCLYGQDITTSHTPPMASLGWLVGKDRRGDDPARANFNGASIILPQLASPSSTLPQRRIGLTIEKGAPAREGAVIVDLADGGKTQIGVVTSGLPSPSLGGTNIAMGYIRTGFHKKGTEVGVLVRNKLRKATVSAMPWVENKFYRKK